MFIIYYKWRNGKRYIMKTWSLFKASCTNEVAVRTCGKVSSTCYLMYLTAYTNTLLSTFFSPLFSVCW